MAGTGHGATLALSTTSQSWAIRSMTLPEWVLGKIETSHLGTTTFKTYCPGDLKEPGEVVATVLANVDDDSPPAGGVVETGTVTFPIHTTGNTTNATLAGTGFITTVSLGELVSETLQEWTVTFAFDGETEPTFTGEAA